MIIRDCKFLGFKPLSNRNYSEAIQLDPGIESLGDYYQNINVLVDNCYFGSNPQNTTTGFGAWGAGLGTMLIHMGIRTKYKGHKLQVRWNALCRGKGFQLV